MKSSKKSAGDKCSLAAVAFERSHGSTNLLKASLSSLMRLLVAKGVVSEDELIKSLMTEFNYLQNLQKRKPKA